MSGSPRQGCRASLPFGALIVQALFFLCLAVSGVFRLMLGLMTGKMLEYARSSRRTNIVHFSSVCNLFVLLPQSAGSPAQHV